ncbi:MAG: HAD family phosphatase [Vicinamibacterales bacterium]
MSALHAVIFDFDGVLADSERLHLRAFQAVLHDTDVVLTDEAYYASYLGYDDHGVFRHLFHDQARMLDTDALETLVTAKGHHYDRLAAAGELLFPGAAAFVRTVAARVPVAIASGAQTHEIEDVLTRAGLRDAFVTVVGADQTPASKPAPDPYLEAFARLCRHTGTALQPRRTVAIEDSRWGLESARGAGLRTVAVTTSYGAADLAPHADLVAAGLHALDLATLERLCGPVS